MSFISHLDGGDPPPQSLYVISHLVAFQFIISQFDLSVQAKLGYYINCEQLLEISINTFSI